jgi:hypothetical protein
MHRLFFYFPTSLAFAALAKGIDDIDLSTFIIVDVYGAVGATGAA